MNALKHGRFTAEVEDHMSEVSTSVQKAIAYSVCGANTPAKLSKVDGLAVGTDVRLSGIKVGTVTALTRVGGENVGTRNITGGSFSSASGNYFAPTFTGTPTLGITPA